MRTAIILHGVCDAHEYYEMEFPSPSNAHWIPWLQQKFLRSGVLCQALEMPTPYEPHYEEWKANFRTAQLDAESIVVAHSGGSGFFLKWLSEKENEERRVAKLVLVAPWMDPARTKGDFLKFALSPKLNEKIGEIHVLFADNERVEGVLETKDLILQTLPKAQGHLFEGKGHFCLSDLGAPAFPELWELCKPVEAQVS